MPEEDKNAESRTEGATVASENTENEQPNNELVMAEQNEVEEVQPTQNKSMWGESFFAVTKSLIIRALIIYFISTLFQRFRTDSQVPATSPSAATTPRSPSRNWFDNGTVFDIWIYLSESEEFTNFDDTKSLIWHEKNLIYGDWYGGVNVDGTRQILYTFKPSDTFKNNGSIYLHVYAAKSGHVLASPNSKRSGLQNAHVSYTRKMLNSYKIVKYKKTHNLLTGETSATKEQMEKAESMKQEIVSHWHPNLTINMVTDQTNWVQGQVPPPLDEFVDFIPHQNVYKPVIFLNDFWNMQRDYQPLNSSVEELELRLTYQPLSLLKWQLYLAQFMRKQWTSSFMGDSLDDDDSDQDTLKEALLDTNPYLLGMTIAVSILHSIFEFLAFKNDIQFWNNRKSLEGLSVRSVFFNVFQALIVMLYVFDNDTNTVVRISCLIGLCIEVWKINKVIDISISRESRLLGIFPKITFHDKGSYVESSTKEYDRLAFKYLSWGLFPLLGGYAIYALMYLEHKSWYSFVLNMLYGFLLTFGFIMMTPQLFINYKLKSVAHLPWRMMSYKFLNTFIDDIFAFIIRMPTLYRLGCFRDDIIFIIFLYQRWIYKIDHTRVNEFGFTGEMEGQAGLENKQIAITAKDAGEEKDAVAKKSD